jgi:dTDP-glucose 4,6-dehydratase
MVGAQHKEVNNRKLSKMILKVLDKDDNYIQPVKDRPAHDRRYAVDWSKIAKLGWKPKYDLETWLVKTIDWYKDNKTWWNRVKSGEYKNYYKRVYGKR